jgi:hypothetical protein
MYKTIRIYRENSGSICTLTDNDYDEVLQALNASKYTSRTNGRTIYQSLLDPIVNDLTAEAENNLSSGTFDQDQAFKYPENCHTLARKMNEDHGYKVVPGFVVVIQNLGKDSIVLLSHSIVRDNQGQAIELTCLFDPDSTHFIEHISGECGIDLVAKV